MTDYMHDDSEDGFLDIACDLVDMCLRIIDDVKWLIFGGDICRQQSLQD